MNRNERLAVALHDIEPATFERCALIRDWLSDLGVDRVTLLVIPGADQPSPALAEWLCERRQAGDAIVHARAERGSSFDWWLAPGLWRAGALLHRPAALRVDVHPTDLTTPMRVRAFENTLRRELARRTSVTYDALIDRPLPVSGVHSLPL